MGLLGVPVSFVPKMPEATGAGGRALEATMGRPMLQSMQARIAIDAGQSTVGTQLSLDDCVF